jgi:hypothetical protein
MHAHRKSSVAVELAYRLKSRCNVFWTHGSTKELFKTSFLSIGEKSHVLIGPAKGDEVIVRDWLDSDESALWLLIVDDVDNPENIQSILPTNRGAILYTTSDREIAEHIIDGGQEVHIESMTSDEAQSLFLKLGSPLPNLKEREVLDLVELLGCFPLAVVQAFAYIHHHSKSVRKYAQELQEGMARRSSSNSNVTNLFSKLPRGVHDNTTQRQSILETWDISYRPLVDANECAAKLLQIISLLSPNLYRGKCYSLQFLDG